MQQDFFSAETPTTGTDSAQVWQIDDPAGTPTYVDFTAELASAATNDVDPWPATEVAGDQLAIGHTSTFHGLSIDVGTVGIGGTLTWKYWNGTAWTAVSGLSDGTVGFTVAGPNNVTWTVPSDWIARSLNGSASLFYIVAEVATTYGTNPILDEGSVLGGFSVVPLVDLEFIGNEWELYLQAGAGPVEFSFNGQDVHGILDSSERTLITRERTARNVLWLRSIAGTETVEVSAWT